MTPQQLSFFNSHYDNACYLRMMGFVAKAPKDNPRFVITNMKPTPQRLYEEVYCRRGEIENRIKELHALEIDRTSCSRCSHDATLASGEPCVRLLFQ